MATKTAAANASQTTAAKTEPTPEPPLFCGVFGGSTPKPAAAAVSSANGGPRHGVAVLDEGQLEGGSSVVIRNALCPEGQLVHTVNATFASSVEGEPPTPLTTLYDTFLYGVQRNPKAPCLGRRQLPQTKTTKKNQPGYLFSTYEQVHADAVALGIYLRYSLGIEDQARVGLSGKNAAEYLTAIQGCFTQGFTTVPIYDTFGKTECHHIMRQADVRCIFVSSENASSIMEWVGALESDGAAIQKIIVWGKTPVGITLDDKFILYDECVKLGKELLSEDAAAVKKVAAEAKASGTESTTTKKCVATPPKAEDLAIIMYTSGTTGMPKGVMLPHSALVATLGAAELYFKSFNVELSAKDVFISFLPLAHVFDFFCENLFLFFGAAIGYFGGDPKLLVEDVAALRPTVFVGVPRVFEKIYKKVDSMVQGGSFTKRTLFNYFFEQKSASLAKGAKFSKASFLGDKLIFSKVKARLGGRVKIICSGGAPLPNHVEEWLKVCFCCPVVQGYGLTETCGASAVAIPDRSDQFGTVGPPMFCLDVKLDPVPTMGYDGTADGGGEICFRGPSVMKGYYKNPEATSEVLEAETGWFHTGDIGKLVSRGCIKIVDRKKQLFKLSQGEYVSPEKVEGVASMSTLVSQIFVHGTSTEAVLIAVVVPSETAVAQFGTVDTKVIKDEANLKKAILEDLNKVCRLSNRLKGYEIPKGVILHNQEFTPESGFVTPSFKLKRPFLRKHFAKEIEEVYATLR